MTEQVELKPLRRRRTMGTPQHAATPIVEVGRPDATRRGEQASFEFHFYCNSVPFDADTINLNTSLGGSESALIYLARGLVERGHRVAIFTLMKRDEQGRPWTTNCKDDHGIWWFDHEMMEPIVRARQPDVFISLRMPQVFQWYVLADCKLRILWNEDLLTDGKEYLGNAWQIDLHAFVSDYHCEQYVREIPAIEEAGLTWATTNPIDVSQIEHATRGVLKDPNRLIHVSRPERALVQGDRSPLLEIFGRMRQQNPDLTLGVCRYHSMYENNPNVAAICRRADELVAQAEGVEWLGELNKADLYREIARSQLVVYPGAVDFAETCCIAALEAQACGTPMVATDIGALRETLPQDSGARIRGNALEEDYQAAFATTCLEYLTDPVDYERACTAGRAFAEQFDYSIVAEQWETKCRELFAVRYRANLARVFDRCMWHDDVRAAREVATDLDTSNEVVPYDASHAIECHLHDNDDTPDSYAEHAMDPAHEADTSPRQRLLEEALPGIYKDDTHLDVKHILDFAGGNGSHSAQLLTLFPNAQVDLVDFSPALCEAARTFIDQLEDGAYVGRFDQLEDGAYAERFTTTVGSMSEIPRHDYDLIFAGEIAEHFEKPEEFLTELQTHARLDGYIVITVPQGPFCALMHRNSLDWSEHQKGHRFAFEARDIEEIFGLKPGYNMLHMPMPWTPRNELTGHFLVYWRNDAKPLGTPDTRRKVLRVRPRERLAVCMIAKDSEATIAQALQSVDLIADEIWVADTGSTDRTMEIAERYVRNGGAVWSIGRDPDAPAELPDPGNFGWARNESISRVTADWVLWLDTDEMLTAPAAIHAHMVLNPYNGYVLRQCHLTHDTLTDEMIAAKRPFAFDKPIRLWRRHPVGAQAGVAYRCYAAIHEHFQVSVNDLINPTIVLSDCDIDHWGYVTEPRRRMKCEQRNVPLLAYDRTLYPDRELGKLLVAREYVNFAKWEQQDRSQQAGRPVATVVDTMPKLQRAIEIIHENFFDPLGFYWEAVLPVYQDILNISGIGMEFGVFEVTEQGKMVAKTLRFADLEHYEIYMAAQTQRLRDLGRGPAINWDADLLAPEAQDPTVDPVVMSPAAPPIESATAAGEAGPEPEYVTATSTLSGGHYYRQGPGHYTRIPE